MSERLTATPLTDAASTATPTTATPSKVPASRRRRGRHRRARVWVGAGAAVVASAAVVVAAVGVDLGPAPAADTGRPQPATADVTRTSLVRTEKVSGTLGYGDPRTLAGRGGTVTWLPVEGAIIDRGGQVYRCDDRPVPLLLGTLPVYRPLSAGVQGGDVAQFEQNLVALGYAGFTVDDTYTSATADAVRRWQQDLGLTETGRIEPDAVVVAAAAIRIADTKAAVGDPATGPVLSYTATGRAVTVGLDVAKQQYVRVGLAAMITLPDDSTVEGTVAAVGTVATTAAGGAGSQPATTITVSVTVADQKALGTFDAAPVSVTLVSDRRDNVLTVPVTALVALAEGGYGVEVVEETGTRYVAVHTGLFAAGRVEIAGDGITEDTVVGVPA